MNHNFGIRMILFFAMIAWSCIAVSALDETKETETLTLRTIAYHEITALTDDISCHNGAMPVISDNGESATFIAYPDGKAHLYVVKTDGTKPPRDVYSFDHNMDAPVAISPDGTKAATGNGFQIGFADLLSGRKTDFLLDGQAANNFKITNSGKVYFIARGDTQIRYAGRKETSFGLFT